MLVLERLCGESLILRDRDTGREIARVKVVKVGKRVRLGVSAPPEVVVQRDEVDAEKQAATR